MNTTYLTSAQLKEKARMQLRGNYGIAIAMQVLVQIANLFSSMLLSFFISSGTILSWLLQMGAGLIISVFLGVFNVGITLFCLNLACQRPVSIENLIYGFRNQFEKVLVLSLVSTAISYVYQLIIQLPLNLYYSSFNIVYLLASFPIIIVALIVFTYLSLLFSQIYFLHLDFPGYSAGKVLRQSMQVIKGHKGRLLYIELSFLPLILLSLLTCGIGLLWVVPYQNMTLANFYLDLMNPQTNQSHF